MNQSPVIPFPQREANNRPVSRERLTPQSLEAEQSTLGAMLIERDAVARAVELLTVDDFYRELHKKIYKVVLKLFDKGEPIDIVTVAEELRRAGQLDDVGGSEYLSALIEACPSSANIEAYARVVSEKSVLRQLVKASDEIAGWAYADGEDDVSQLVDRSEKRIFEIGQKRLRAGFTHIKPLLMTAYDQIERQFQHRGEATGISTGFVDLDDITSGLQPTDLIILAARPSMGKCCHEDVKIIDPHTGAIRTIKEMIARKQEEVLNLSVSGQLQTARVSDWIDSGVKPVYRVTTRLGRHVEVTGHHPFLTVQGWQPLHDLKVGNKIAVPRRVGIFGRDTSSSLEKVRLLAYLIAEGGISCNTVNFTNADIGMVEDFSHCAQHTFPGCTVSQCGQTITHRILKVKGAQYNAARVWLDELGLMGKLAKDKFIPNCVWSMDKMRLAEFLRVLFSCDATIYKLGNYPRIEFTVASKQLAEDVQHALLRFGVIAKLWAKSSKFKEKTFESWRVEITDPSSVLRYQTEIGWIGEKAGRFLETRAELPKRASNNSHAPREIWDLVKASAVRQGISLSQLARLAGETEKTGQYAGYNPHTKRGLPSHRLQKYAEILQDAALLRAASPDIYWDEIVSIEDIGEHQVYDLTVPDGSNFIAQDICVHNTALCLNIAHHIALKERQPVAVFSLEMSKEQLVQRLICSEASIKSQDLRRGKVQDSDWHRITNAVNNLYQAPIFIDDQPGQGTFEMRAKARRLTAEHGQLGLIVVDYLQLAHSSGKSENRVQEISEIARAFKSMARELKCPLIALSQLSRAVETREDKRPMLSDLRESGSIEAEADVVAFIYRPSYYKRKMLHKDGQPDPNAEPDPDEGMAEVIIGKQRNGPVGTIRLGFQPEYARFTNLARSDYGGDY